MKNSRKLSKLLLATLVASMITAPVQARPGVVYRYAVRFLNSALGLFNGKNKATYDTAKRVAGKVNKAKNAVVDARPVLERDAVYAERVGAAEQLVTQAGKFAKTDAGKAIGIGVGATLAGKAAVEIGEAQKASRTQRAARQATPVVTKNPRYSEYLRLDMPVHTWPKEVQQEWFAHVQACARQRHGGHFELPCGYENWQEPGGASNGVFVETNANGDKIFKKYLGRNTKTGEIVSAELGVDLTPKGRLEDIQRRVKRYGLDEESTNNIVKIAAENSGCDHLIDNPILLEKGPDGVPTIEQTEGILAAGAEAGLPVVKEDTSLRSRAGNMFNSCLTGLSNGWNSVSTKVANGWNAMPSATNVRTDVQTRWTNGSNKDKAVMVVGATVAAGLATYLGYKAYRWMRPRKTTSAITHEADTAHTNEMGIANVAQDATFLTALKAEKKLIAPFTIKSGTRNQKRSMKTIVVDLAKFTPVTGDFCSIVQHNSKAAIAYKAAVENMIVFRNQDTKTEDEAKRLVLRVLRAYNNLKKAYAASA